MRCAIILIPRIHICKKTLEWIAQVQPKRAILTNMHVDLDYATLQAELPDDVAPAFDMMSELF